jgi:hypothetical protein
MYIKKNENFEWKVEFVLIQLRKITPPLLILFIPLNSLPLISTFDEEKEEGREKREEEERNKEEKTTDVSFKVPEEEIERREREKGIR